jgi:hypothetical protein
MASRPPLERIENDPATSPGHSLGSHLPPAFGDATLLPLSIFKFREV